MRSSWPSRACFACKAKKIRCDEITPSCKICLKAGKTCVYRPESDLVFRNQNAMAERKVKTRIKARIGAGESPPPLPCLNGSNSPVNGSRDANQKGALRSGELQTRISPPMSTNWKDNAIPRFFADYVFKTRAMSQGDLSFLPDLCARSDLHAPLREALDAVAWLSLSNQLGIEWLTFEACKSYFHAVELMARLLEDPDEAREDATLATNYLFGLFEMISGFKLSGGSWSHYRHHPGRISLLRLRGKGQFTTPVGLNLFRINYAHVTLKSIVEHTKPIEEADIWLDDFPRMDPGLKLAKINLRTARLCHDAQELFDSNSQDKWWILKMLQVIKEAILIDLEYQAWNESLPAPWRHRSFRASASSSGECIAPESVLNAVPPRVYQDVYVAFVSNNCRAARIHLHEIILRCTSLIVYHQLGDSFDAGQTQEQSKAIITEMISEICASTAFCLGDINSTGQLAPPGCSRMPLGGYLMLWALWRAYNSAGDDSERRLWLRGKLEYISNFMGIRAALALTERKRNNPWDLRWVTEDEG